MLTCAEQMLNSLRSLRNSAAKKRAKVNLSSPDPDSPDSAVKLDLALDSPSHTSPLLTSSASESGLSSLSSVASSSVNGIKTRYTKYNFAAFSRDCFKCYFTLRHSLTCHHLCAVLDLHYAN